jgi:hypothetical protein
MPIGQAKFGLLGGVVDPGKLELIETQTYSTSVNYVDFTSIQESNYNVHLMTLTNITFNVLSNLRIQFYESGVLETASVYQFARQICGTAGSFAESKSTANGQITIVNTATSTRNTNGYIYLYNLGNSSKYSFLSHHCTGGHTENTFTFGSGVLPQASTVDGIRCLAGTGGNTFTGFDISLYGIAES